jgi:hypothetical protein
MSAGRGFFDCWSVESDDMKNPTQFGLSALLAFMSALAGALAVKRDQPPRQIAIGIVVFTITWLMFWVVVRRLFPR